MQLDGCGRRGGEADGDLLRQHALEVNLVAKVVIRPVTGATKPIAEVQPHGQDAGDVVVLDDGGHVPDEGEAGQGQGRLGHDGVDVDAEVVVGGVGVVHDGVVEGVELHGDEPVVAGGHLVGGLVGEAEVVGVGAGEPRREAGEEEGHAGALVVDAAVLFGRVDDEGEAGGEAGNLAGGGVPERDRKGVRHPATAVFDAAVPVGADVDPPAAVAAEGEVGAEGGVAFQPDVRLLVRAEVGVVEGQGQGDWSRRVEIVAEDGEEEDEA
ncbi:Os08g0124050, partial [Oryza sativa Japonica Group]